MERIQFVCQLVIENRDKTDLIYTIVFGSTYKQELIMATTVVKTNIAIYHLYPLIKRNLSTTQEAAEHLKQRILMHAQ